VPTPVLVPLTCVSLPNRDAHSSAPPPRLASRSIVRINVHGSKDRAKDASPVRLHDLSCLRPGACALWRMLTAFPSSASFGHPLSSARLRAAEEPLPAKRTDLGLRSDDPPRRVPPSRKPGCLRPPRHAKEGMREGIAPSGLRAGSLAHAAHTLTPDWGQCCLIGHCEVTVRSPADP